MPSMRARDQERTFRRDVPVAAPLLTVRAGETITVRVSAVDRQSGVAEVVARCRAQDNRDLTCAGQWVAASRRRALEDHYFSVPVAIPDRSPTVVWEVHQILLADHDGNRRTYVAGKDFAPMLFQVVGREGLDSTPPRLLGVQLCRDATAAE